MFYQCTMVDVDVDSALDGLIFLSAHLAINTQLYSEILNAITLRQLSISMTEQIEQSN